jgi:DNA (cytosine-5)-methyltransferase 1
MAGYRELLAMDRDPLAIWTFRRNFPEVPTYLGDIRELSIDQCMRLAKIDSRRLDVLDGSPPCQGFSMAGSRRLDDARNGLWMEFVRLLRGLSPNAFVMENVLGLVRGGMRIVFATMLREMKAAGYEVRVRALDAMYFGVPQSRTRLIFIGIRRDLGVEPTQPGFEGRPIAVGPLKIGDGRRVARSSASRIIRSHRYRPLMPDRPSPTICHRTRGLQNDDIYWREDESLRQVSIAERKLIGSFPESFRFACGPDIASQLMGNSVPPLFMRAIARHVRTLIGSGTNRIELRSPSKKSTGIST